MLAYSWFARTAAINRYSRRNISAIDLKFEFGQRPWGIPGVVVLSLNLNPGVFGIGQYR
jgi:hypothetical protein